MKKAMGTRKKRKHTKFYTNTVCAPYPVEVSLKIVSWILWIVIGIINLILTPFLRMGIRCFGLFSIAAVVVSGYAFFSYDIRLSTAFSILVGLLAVFLLFIGFVHLIDWFLMHVISAALMKIIFAPVCISFRRPMFWSRIRNRRFVKWYAAEQAKETGIKANDNPRQAEHGDV